LELWTITRWDSRWKSIDAIVKNYPAIVKALQDLSEENSGKRSINAGGLLMHVRKSIFIITSFILRKLFGLVKVLSDHLKSQLFFLFKLYKKLFSVAWFEAEVCTGQNVLF